MRRVSIDGCDCWVVCVREPTSGRARDLGSALGEQTVFSSMLEERDDIPDPDDAPVTSADSHCVTACSLLFDRSLGHSPVWRRIRA